MIDIIDGEQFRNMIRYGAAAIQAEKQSINELNVFPVPDGDTRHQHEHDHWRGSCRR